MNTEISITYPLGKETAGQFSQFFNGELDSKFGEHTVSFDNNYGQGFIRVLPCGSGLCLLSFDVNFLVDITVKINYSEIIPIDFVFLSCGKLSIKVVDLKKLKIERYQNVIVRYKANESVAYVMGAGEVTQLNIIQIRPKPYLKKNSHYLELQELNIKEMFYSEDTTKFYHHFGNFNLNIADYIRQVNHCQYEGMIRSLIMEGCVNFILALQLAEYENFIAKLKLPENISKEDIVKVEKAAEIIREEIQDNLSVTKLAARVDLTQPKLQSGFKYLYQKTVNNYTKEIKLQHAHNCLMNSDLNISEIVYKVGYSSRSYFTQIFFDRFGMLPNEFKKSSK